MSRACFLAAALAALLAGPPVCAQNIDERIRNVETLQGTTSRKVFGVSNELLTVGSEAMMAGRWSDGIRLTLAGLERAGVSDETRSSALSNLCAAYAALEQAPLAIDYCTQSIELDDQNWRAWSNRSYAYWLKKDYENSGIDLERATSIDDRARQLSVLRGMLNEAGLQPRVLMEDRQ